MKEQIKAWMNNESITEWPIVSDGDSLWYDGKLVGVTYEGEKALRKDFAVNNDIDIEDYNEEWGIITDNSNQENNTMLIVSKKEANNILVNSLFKPVNGHTLNVSKFDNVKYKWTGKAKDYVGKEVVDIPGVHAVYPERRQDSNGAYCQLMCISE